MRWDGRYRIERTLGEGGMGRVVLAEDCARERAPIALKILDPKLPHKDATALFVSEFEIQRQLAHPNIPRAHEFGIAQHTATGTPYFAMDYVSGRPLGRLETVSADDVLTITLQLLRALDHMHRSGWLHRDIKPANIIIGANLQSETSVQLIDFGVAIPTRQAPAQIMLGTPEYAAPELLSGRPLDPRSDLFSLGVVLFELFEGQRPWIGSDVRDLLEARLYGELPEISADECPQWLAELVYSLLEPEPYERPASAAVVIKHILEQAEREVVIESPRAFAQRIARITLPAATAVAEAMTEWEGQGGALILESAVYAEHHRHLQDAAQRIGTQGIPTLSLELSQSCTRAYEALIPLFTLLEETDSGPIVRDSSALIAALSMRQQRLALFIEGLNHADANSLECLATILNTRPDLMTLLASVDKRSSLADTYPRFYEQARAERVTISAMNPKNVSTWLAKALEPELVGPEVSHKLTTRSGGCSAALRHMVETGFNQGAIERSIHGYTIDHRELLTSLSADKLEPLARESMMRRLACINQCLPKKSLQRVLGTNAQHIPELLSKGILRQHDTQVEVMMSEATREELAPTPQDFEAFAGALKTGDDFDQRNALIGTALMRSVRPVRAVPYLLRATAAAHDSKKTDTYMTLASELLERDEGNHANSWRWQVMLNKTRLRLALSKGALDIAAEICAELLLLGADRGHKATICHALDWRLVISKERQDWHQLVIDTHARKSLDGQDPSAETLANCRWAEALQLHADNRSREALARLELGQEEHEELPPPIKLRLVGARAEILIQSLDVQGAEEAVDSFLRDAMRCGGTRERVDAGLLYVDLLLALGRPEDALLEVQHLAHELPSRHATRLDGLLALGLSRCHLAFGWAGRAHEHALDAIASAERDQLPQLKARAWLAQAGALRLLGKLEDARRLTNRVIQSARAEGIEWLTTDASLLHYELVLHLERRSASSRIKHDAGQLGHAQRQHCPARAASAFMIAIRAALLLEQWSEAEELADLAMDCLNKGAGDHNKAIIYHRCSQAYARVGAIKMAESCFDKAVSALNTTVASIEDPNYRRALLSLPEYALILARRRERQHR